jgi:hypothetical protein
VFSTSATLRLILSETPFRPEDEDHDQDREHDRLRPVGPRHVPREALVPRLDQADRDGAEDGARQVADAAEHRGGERDQPKLEALVEPHRRRPQRVERPRGAGERAGDEERERDRPVDIDAHDCGRILVLRRRAHRLSLSCPLHEPEECEQHRNGEDHDDQVVPLVVDAADREHVRVREDIGRRHIVRAFPGEADVLDDEAHADRGD